MASTAQHSTGFRPHIAIPVKDPNSHLEVNFLLNAYGFHTIIKSKNLKSNHRLSLGPSVHIYKYNKNSKKKITQLSLTYVCHSYNQESYVSFKTFLRISTHLRLSAPIFWPPHVKSWLIGKDSDAGRDWGQEEKGWDGWMASPTRWTWVWVNSGSWWWTGSPGVLRFMESQRVRHDWATELNWTEGFQTWCIIWRQQTSHLLTSYSTGRAFQVVLVVKNLPANAEDVKDVGSIPELGRSPGRGYGNPLQYSCLENPVDRGAWWIIVHGITKSWTWLNIWS